MKIIPVILCGGAGTRLWPESKDNLPKQFVDWGGWTLFGKTLDRVKNSIFDYPIITTNLNYLNLVKKHLLKHRIKKYRIILEPSKKNTAAAILSPALLKDIENDQPMVFFSADNLIDNVKKFNKSISIYKQHLDDDNIFIFGIKPTSFSSAYGYFLSKKNLQGLDKVYKFIEKPKKKKLNFIIKKKGYMNSGMFFIRKDSIIKNFRKYQKKIYKNCELAIKKSKQNKNVYYLNKLNFNKIKAISCDYAVLEKSKNINAIKLNISLSDLGNWKEIWRFFKKYNSKESIKKNTFYRPWGKYINLFHGRGFLLKELVINSNSSISLQKHHHRSERWTIISGKPKITINKKKFIKKSNDNVFIPRGAIHRIENPFKEPVKIAEVQMGNILKETDIVRYKDVYGRIK